MAPNKRPRKSYQRPDYRAQAQRDAETTYAENIGRELPPVTPVDKEPPAPAHPHVVHPSAPRAPRGRPRYLVPVAAGAGVIGGAAFLTHRARRKKATMAKALVNPLTGDGVVFEKRYLEDDVDETPRGVLVAKGAKFNAFRRELGGARNLLPSKRKQGAIVGGAAMYGFDRATGGHARRKAGRQAMKTEAGDARMKRIYSQMDHLERGKKTLSEEDARKFGALEDKMVSRHRQRTGDQMRRNEYERAAKRYDETALDRVGRRRGGNTPVSSVRVPGLPVQTASFSRGDPEARPGTRSHALKLTQVHTKVKHHPRGTLVQVGHGRRKATGPIKKNLASSSAFAQSAGNGRRLVNV